MIRDLHPHTRPQRTRDPKDVSSQARELGYEPSDWPVGLIFRSAPALALLLGVALGAGWLAISMLKPDRPAAGAQGTVAETPPPPRLQPHPARDLARNFEGQDRNLRQAPVSVERAMDQVAAQGWREDRPAKREGR
ncbi:hypothetical protein WBP06_03995 [Novosphingobium sp. BL-8H]|uniref:hypothetical protein n=1 Tax=Novosphingobium sp. BL-8H TaxID=3127640 RepID=UPI0037575DAE